MSSLTESIKQFTSRKRDHIRLALDPRNEALGKSKLDHIHLTHEALPDLDFGQISIVSSRFGKKIPNPFLVSSMTAGHLDSTNINETLARACQLHHWAMGVGSQRRQLFDKEAAREWENLRRIAPDIHLFGNLGISQLIHCDIQEIERLVSSLNAEAMIIHTNPLQECLQPEGTPQFAGAYRAIAELAEKLSVPVILKETGCGFSSSTLEKLNNTRIAAVDLSGFGGTHWGRIEGQRSTENEKLARAAETFSDWGISTVDALCHAHHLNPHYEIWASGGVRTGLDAAKLLALDAKTVGFAKPLLAAALEGIDAVSNLMESIEYELKIALFCTGSRNIEALQGKVVCQ